MSPVASEDVTDQTGSAAGVEASSPGHRWLIAVFQVPEGYIGFVEELPGANTQGATLEEARANLQGAIPLVLEANRLLAEESLRDKEVIREALQVTGA